MNRHLLLFVLLTLSVLAGGLALAQDPASAGDDQCLDLGLDPPEEDDNTLTPEEVAANQREVDRMAVDAWIARVRATCGKRSPRYATENHWVTTSPGTHAEAEARCRELRTAEAGGDQGIFEFCSGGGELALIQLYVQGTCEACGGGSPECAQATSLRTGAAKGDDHYRDWLLRAYGVPDRETACRILAAGLR